MNLQDHFLNLLLMHLIILKEQKYSKKIENPHFLISGFDEKRDHLKFV